jgi:hypothetical protein
MLLAVDGVPEMLVPEPESGQAVKVDMPTAQEIFGAHFEFLLYAFRLRILFADVLQPFGPDADNPQRAPGGSSRPENRWAMDGPLSTSKR